jgi:TPR repeat protein
VAAKQNDREAMFQLSLLYTHPENEKQNTEKANFWLAKAAEKKHKNAMVLWADQLQNTNPNDNSQQIETLYRQAAEQKHPGAVVKLARWLQQQSPNNPEIVHWYQTALTFPSPHPEALYQLAYLTEHGLLGQTKNFEKSLSLYQKSAKAGHAEAAFQLGKAHYNDQELSANHPQALRWFRKAAIQNHPAAQYYLGWLHSQGTNVPKSPKKSLQWITRSAQNGYPSAQFSLGKIYSDHPQNYLRAYFWLSLATTVKPQAKNALSALKLKMNTEEIQQAEQLLQEWHSRSDL